MAKIKSKQIEGAIDSDTEQFIFSPKYFFSGLGTVAGTDSRSIYIRYGYIYWLQSMNGFVIAPGDFRLGLSSVTGKLAFQQYINGIWDNL